MTAGDGQRLTRLLGGAELRWLVDRVRQRIERGVPVDGSVVLVGAAPAQRRAVERLLGRPIGRGATISVSLPAVEAVLARAGAAPDLRSAVEALTGPVADRAADQAARELAWAAAVRPIEAVARTRPVLQPWVEWLRTTGVLRRVAHGDPGRARELASQASGVLARLPADGVPISVLANLEAGDGHTLDRGSPLSAIVLPAVARLGSIPPGKGSEWRRIAWASVGVLCGELTNPVLTLNLPGDGETATGRALTCWAAAGQPVHLTARQLLRQPPRLDALHGRRVYLCENSSVVAEAANRLGTRCAPLVCTSTHPGAAATVLLCLLAAAGTELLYHGDFDWPGVAIANGIVARFGACLWRLDAAAYRRAATAGGPMLTGRPVAATWDPDLTAAMRELGLKVEEERVIGDLLADLGRSTEAGA
jgi:uncharacterized protein (TIGR02679 family)